MYVGVHFESSVKKLRRTLGEDPDRQIRFFLIQIKTKSSKGLSS